MSTPTDISAVSENDNHSDSDWLDIASTDKDSDDNDSINSSRETDHEDLSHSRSRRSSLSYGSSRDGDVDAWEGLIDDGADEGVPNDVLAPNQHVPSLSQHLALLDSDPVQQASPEELLVKEGLDQSMISTLSSSRSSSLHASTVHNSSRDLRLSFPDPITSSCREPLGTSYEGIQHHSEVLSSPVDSGVPSDAYQVDSEEMLSASQMSSTELQGSPVPSSSGPELDVILYGCSTIYRWSIVNKLLQKVTRGAGLTITQDLLSLQGYTRRLTVSGSFKHDQAFPRVITILDRTLESLDTVDDPALTDTSGARPLAVVFLPSRPLHLPDHVLVLPVLVSPSYLSSPRIGSPESAWDLLNIPHHQILRINAPEESPVVDEDVIDTIDSARVYRSFSRLWSGDNNVSKGAVAGPHTLTIIAILALVLGLIVRAVIPMSQHQFISPIIATLSPNYTSDSFWQVFRPAPYRERLAPSKTLDGSVVAIPSPFKEYSLSVFNAELTSMTLCRTNPTNFRRVVSSALSEHLVFSKDLVLQPPHSVLLPDNRPKALSVVRETNPTASYHPVPVTSAHTVSALVHNSGSGVAKEFASVSFTIMNQDMQDIFDALDALVQAISRQTQIFLAQATTFIEQATKSVESFETIKKKLHANNERARKRAKEIKEMGAKWLSDASEVVTNGAHFSKGMAWEMAESLAHRAQRARGKAKGMAAEIQVFVNECDKLETLAWDTHAKHWKEWVEVVRQGNKGKRCKSFRRKLEPAIFP